MLGNKIFSMLKGQPIVLTFLFFHGTKSDMLNTTGA